MLLACFREVAYNFDASAQSSSNRLTTIARQSLPVIVMFGVRIISGCKFLTSSQ